ncbi:MAG: alpha/beta fold hydrolase [Planctomycetota bacterium]
MEKWLAVVIALLARPPLASAQDPDLVARARRIHARVLTLDTHKDLSPLLARQDFPQEEKARERFRQRYDPAFRGSRQVDFPKMREGGLDAVFFIVYVGQGRLTEAGYKRAKAQALRKFDAIHRMARSYPEQIGIAYTPDDVERIARSGKLVACIGIENGYPMGTDLSLIKRFHELGGRYMSLTHNRHSQLGDSHTPAEPLHGGLSELGRKAIEEMNRVGIMVDVSHSAKKTMLDAVAHSRAPVIASHSSIRALRDHGRNLDDEQLLALKRRGGVVQIVALGDYLKDETGREQAIQKLRAELGLPSGPGQRSGEQGGDLEAKLLTYKKRVQELGEEFRRATVKDLVDHIDYAVKLIGIDHVGISSDFDGGGGIQGWNDASETFNVTLELVRRGYREDEIAKLWSGNTLRLWREVEEVAQRLKAGPREHLGLCYDTKEGVDPGLLSLDVYAPGRGSKHPVLVMIHGGGWRRGDKWGAARLKSRYFTERGFVFVSINYRLSPAVKHPAHVQDVARALAFVHDEIREYGGNPERIFVMGHSAGAHLAALVATDERRLAACGKDLSILKGAILLDCAAYDLPRLFQDFLSGPLAFHEAAFGTDEAGWKDASPVRFVAAGKHIPPFLIFHTGKRPAAKAVSEDLAARLHKAGVVATTVHALPYTHASINRRIGQPTDPATGILQDFLDEILEGGSGRLEAGRR